jgi:tetratricopeptide (TPR) repeat protein
MPMNKIISIILLSSLFLFACNGQETKNTQKKEVVAPNSLGEINQNIEKDPENAIYYAQRAKIHQKANDLNHAIADIQTALNKDPNNIDYYLQLTDYFLASGQMKNAIGVLKKILTLDSKNIEALLKMGEINLMVRKYPEVFTYANAVLEHDPYNSKAFFMRGYTYKEMTDTVRAMENFRDCLKNDPKHYNANIELALIYSNRKDAMAIDYFNNAIAIDSTNEIAYYNLGMFYQNNDYLNEALATYKTLMRIKPKFPYSYYNTGYIYMELLKVPDEAIPYFTQAIQINPGYYEAYFNRGLCFEILGDLYKAKDDYMIALKLHTNYTKAIEGLNRIDEIMSR